MNGVSRHGALVVLALLFASSGALRLGSGIGFSLAHAANNESGVQETDGCSPLPSALAAALAAREARVATQEAALSDREAALQLAEDALRGRMEQLAAAERSLRSTLAIAQIAAEEDLAQLTAVYSAMKPKAAAALFNEMDVDLVAGFIGRMQAGTAAPVLAGMAPEKAYAVSAVIAGRNARAPTD